MSAGRNVQMKGAYNFLLDKAGVEARSWEDTIRALLPPILNVEVEWVETNGNWCFRCLLEGSGAAPLYRPRIEVTPWDDVMSTPWEDFYYAIEDHSPSCIQINVKYLPELLRHPDTLDFMDRGVQGLCIRLFADWYMKEKG